MDRYIASHRKLRITLAGDVTESFAESEMLAEAERAEAAQVRDILLDRHYWERNEDGHWNHVFEYSATAAFWATDEDMARRKLLFGDGAS